MANYNQTISADPDFPGFVRKVKVLTYGINDTDGVFFIIVKVKYFQSNGTTTIKNEGWTYTINITNNTRVSSSGNQFSAGARNATFGVAVPYPVNIANAAAADTIAWIAATPEYDFIKNKTTVTDGTAGNIDLLDYALKKVLILDAQSYFNQ